MIKDNIKKMNSLIKAKKKIDKKYIGCKAYYEIDETNIGIYIVRNKKRFIIASRNPDLIKKHLLL